MQTTANDIKLSLWHDGADKPLLMLPVNMSKQEAITAHETLREALDKGKPLSVEIKPYRAKRSLDANNYCWVLCDKIAQVIGSTKEEVYRKVIRDVGVFQIIGVEREAVDTFIEKWSGGGVGWFAEDVGHHINDERRVMAYFGSSVYNTKEMSRLIDELVNQAKELGIETRPQEEIDSLLKNWEGK